MSVRDIMIKFFTFWAMLIAISALGYTNVTTTDVHNRLLSCDTLLLLDVREWSEYSSGHIAEPAGQLPLTPVIMPWNSSVLSAEYGRLPTDIDIIVYCAAGGRSAAASSFLDGKGFTRVFNMTGGFSSWAYESRSGGFGDHTGEWVQPSDTEPATVTEYSTGDTSEIIFYPEALPGTDSVYLELHFASFSTPIPPNVPESDLDGLFRITALDQFGLSVFTTDSFVLDDTVGIDLIPKYPTRERLYYSTAEELTALVPGECWCDQTFYFSYPVFHRAEPILRRWYNTEGFGYMNIATVMQPSQLEISAFPNPFNSTIALALQGVGETLRSPGQIAVEIYDISGRLIYAPSPSVPLPKGEGGQILLPPGEGGSESRMRAFIWQPDESVTSGVYLVRATAGEQTVTKRIVYLK